MPLEYSIKNTLVSTRLWGEITLDECREFALRLSQDSLFRSDFDEIVDFSDANLSLSSNELQQLARLSPFGDSSHRAFVAPQDLKFGLSRAYGVYQEEKGAEVRVFRDSDAALAWLGISHGT